jgi:hypothetical protein
LTVDLLVAVAGQLFDNGGREQMKMALIQIFCSPGKKGVGESRHFGRISIQFPAFQNLFDITIV